MEDREMLEWAARAAGHKDFHHGEGKHGTHSFFVGKRQCVMEDPSPWEWNPLDSDGDALRLAVNLRMLVDINHEGSYAQHEEVSHADRTPGEATRRAITRAAAEIGKAMA